MSKRILVPVSDTLDDSAVKLVRAVAHDQGSTVRLLRVMPVPQRAIDERGRTVSYADQEMASLTAHGLRSMEAAESQLEGVPTEAVVRFGDPLEEILLEAEAFHADLIAVTTHDSGRIKRALAPELGDRVLNEADVPVLLLRG